MSQLDRAIEFTRDERERTHIIFNFHDLKARWWLRRRRRQEVRPGPHLHAGLLVAHA